MTMRAFVRNDFYRDSLAIFIGQSLDEGRTRVLQPDGSWLEPEPGVAFDDVPTLRLREDAARALLDSLAAHFGGVSEVQTLRVDYLAERGRVDKLTDALIRQTDAYVRFDTSMQPVAVPEVRRWAATTRRPATCLRSPANWR